MIGLLSAANWIADAVFFGLLGVAMVAGLIGGLSRALKGFFAAVFIIFSTVLIVGAAIEPMCNTPVANSICASIEDGAKDWGRAFTTPVYIAEDGSYYLHFKTDNGDFQDIPLADAAEEPALADKTKAALAQELAKRFVHEDNQGDSLAHVAAKMITTVVVGAIAFVGIAIGAGILFFLLRFLFRRAVFTNGVLGALNKLLGMAVAGFMALVFLLIVMSILKAFHIAGVDEYFSRSPAVGYLYFNNPLATFLTRVFG